MDRTLRNKDFTMNHKKYLAILLLLAVPLLLLATAGRRGNGSSHSLAGALDDMQSSAVRPGIVNMVTAHTNAARVAATTAPIVGTYAGVVIVSEPAALGALDLVFDITSSDNDNIVGNVNAARTQVFLGGPAITGRVTGRDSISPTLHIESTAFASVVSGRDVTRQFTLSGTILDDGNKLQGQYAETITGFTPEPLQIIGTFLVVRPNGSDQIVFNPNIPTVTPTPTQPSTGNPATATPTPTKVGPNPPQVTPTPPTSGTKTPPDGSTIYMPVVANGVESARSADVMVAQPTATPVPTAEGGTVKLPPTPTDTGGTTTLPPHAVYLPILAKE